MIHVHRDSVPAPAILGPDPDSPGLQELASANAFYQDSANAGQTYEFKVYLSPEIESALHTLFKGKCAFCESFVSGSTYKGIEHFRPKNMAVNLDGSVTKPGYWWLAVEWSNLYLICNECNNSKRNRFPIVGRMGSYESGIGDEKALLLDPCTDNPENYLIFLEDGMVASFPPDTEALKKLDGNKYQGHDRGAISIDIFGLNRNELVTARQAVINEVSARLTKLEILIRTSSKGDLQEIIKAETDNAINGILQEDQQFLALRRQMVARWMGRLEGDKELSGAIYSIDSLPSALVEEDLAVEEVSSQELIQQFVQQSIPVESVERVYDELEKKSKARMSFSVEDETRQEIYVRSSNISRIEIKNFKPIDYLSFSFGPGTPEKIGWKVLLGDNAVGKSSVLQAVGLTLMGSERMQSLGLVDPASLLRRGEKEGYVRVYLSSDTEPLEMRLNPEGVEFPGAYRGLQTQVLGFGSARWLPKPGSFPPETDKYVRIRNLFNPFVPLTDAVTWLLELSQNEPGKFRKIEEVLARFLQFQPGTRLRRRGDRIYILAEGQSLSNALSLDQLSDGYQTLLAMAGAIMQMMGELWEDLQAAEGIVLLDEIGTHLHPRWKLQVVTSMRQAFPNLQFLATTHEPLCLRGLFEGEVLVLRRREDELIVLDNLPSPDNLRIDQLLTSNLFGLLSTLHPDLENDYERYNRILTKNDDRRTEQENRWAKNFRESSLSERVLGDTPRAQMIYELVDEYLARSRFEQDNEARARLKASTKKKVARLWEEMKSEGET
jgi:uncharacterized protein (TIGR02646 family)